MRTAWILVMATGAAISAGLAELAAQGRGSVGRQERNRAAERGAERERLRVAREREEREMRTSTVRSPVYADSRRVDERDARRYERTYGDIYGTTKNRNGN